MRIAHVLAGALPALALSAAPAAAQGRWVVGYPVPQNPEYQALQQVFSQQDILAQAVDPLNEGFPIERDVAVELAECGSEGAFYDPERPAVRICYELLMALAQSVMGDDGGEEVFAGAFAFILLHQLGHAMIDQMDLPASAAPEEAADQLSAVMVASAAQDLEMVADGILALSESPLDWENPGSGRTALSGPRLQTLLCLLYGANPQGYAWAVDEGYLTPARAERCPAEYEAVLAEWTGLLGDDVQS